MTEQDIADYLKNHPDFFIHRPELLQQLTIPHSHEEGTISLVEAQLAQQREQIKTLTQLLEKFHQLAHQEADIFFALLPLQKTSASSFWPPVRIYSILWNGLLYLP
jgi:uncharacterized protein YigA (DUF484 family)